MMLKTGRLAALASILAACGGCFAQPVTENKLAIVLDGGDYVHPTFSPSGDLLALSQVISDSGGESTQILLIPLAQATVDTLLADSEANRYAVYKAYVSGFMWRNDHELVAMISDGDVGSTAVAFDVRTGTMISREHIESGIDEWPPSYQPLADSLGELYPDVAPAGHDPAAVFGSALGWPTVREGHLVVLQKHYSGVDSDIWEYRLDRPAASRLMHIPEWLGSEFAGGFVAGTATIFGVGGRPEVHLYRWDAGRLDTLVAVAADIQPARVMVRGRSDDTVWFLVDTFRSYERGHNPAFYYTGESLVEIDRFAELYDFDVHIGTRRAAFSYWEGEQRHVLITELPGS